MEWFFGLIFAFLFAAFAVTPAEAIVDPLSVPNNKFGIHIITPIPQEASEAAELVNTNGDWGYVTVIIQDNDRNKDKWQEFFNELRRRHLIPLVRIATRNEGTAWKRPVEGDENGWADFLNSLIWPTKNRYVIIFNEPNHANEWGGSVDAKNYAQTLDKYITALKTRSDDFFVLNGAVDVSAPQEMPNYQDAADYLKQMNEAVPGLFERLDGWSSHSYPNPNFSGSPNDSGRGSIRTYLWEKQFLRSLGVKKDLPIFITETGWKHAEGLNRDNSYPSADTTAKYFQTAFETAWNNPQIVAITPFLLNYQEAPFDRFSFKRPTGEKQNVRLTQVLGEQFPSYYPQYELIRNLSKQVGQPVRENKAVLIGSNLSGTIAVDEEYNIYIKVKNTGQTIWGETGPVRVIPILGGSELGIQAGSLQDGVRVEPGQEHTFTIKFKSSSLGEFNGSLALFNGDKQFTSEPFSFTVNVKSPVSLKIKSALAWKNSPAGLYTLSFIDGTTETIQQSALGSDGSSGQVQMRNLLPDKSYNFTLSKPYYHSKTIRQTVRSGENTLDFGKLQPDLASAILNPPELWKLLPISN